MPEPAARTDVLFVNMPLSTVERPCLPLGIFTSILRQNAIATRTLYANVELLRYVDGATYSLLARMPSSYAYCDWLFAPLAFPESTADPDAYVDMLLEKVPLLLGEEAEAFGDDRDPRVFLKELRETMSGFLDDMVERALSFDPKVVGCTSTFQQHVPSLALLRRSKQARPGIVTMLGGPNCETELGPATPGPFDHARHIASTETGKRFTSPTSLARPSTTWIRFRRPITPTTSRLYGRFPGSTTRSSSRCRSKARAAVTGDAASSAGSTASEAGRGRRARRSSSRR